MTDLRLEAEYAEADRALDAAIATGSAEEYGAALARWEKAADAKTWAAPRAKAPASPQANPELGPMREQLERVKVEFDAIPADDQTRPAKARQLQILAGAIEEAEASEPYMAMTDDELTAATRAARLEAEEAEASIAGIREKYGPESEHAKHAEDKLADLRLEPARVGGELKRREQERQIRTVFATQSKVDAEQEVGTADHLALANWKSSHRGSEFEFEAMKLERDLEGSRPKRIEKRAAALLAEKLGRLGRVS